MAITTSGNVTSEQTAKEYAIKFGLLASEPSVKWVKEHQQEYLELVRSKDAIARDNALDPDKFPIRINVNPIPNMVTLLSGDQVANKYLGTSLPEDPTSTRQIAVNTGTFHPSLTTKDRQAIIAHEIGHHINPNGAGKQQEVIKKALSEYFDWLKPVKESLKSAASYVGREEETRADRVGAELLCNGKQMSQMLENLKKIEIPDGKGGVFIIPAEVHANSTHPGLNDRIQALADADTEIKRICRKR